MSIKFSQRYGKIKIAFFGGASRGYSIYADNEEEAVNCLKHYYCMKHNKKKCPSCRK